MNATVPGASVPQSGVAGAAAEEPDRASGPRIGTGWNSGEGERRAGGIVWVTDLSSGATKAGDAAGALATRLAAPLNLVHVVDASGQELSEEAQTDLRHEVRGRLHAEADRLRARGVAVQEEVLYGITDEALVSHADRWDARLIVVSFADQSAATKSLLASIAEHKVHTPPIPVLILRDASPFLAWVEGKRRLRVMAAVNFSSSATTAIHWVADLRALGPCDVVVAYSSWPPAERRRLGTGIRWTVFENDPEIETELRRDLERKVGTLPGDGEVRIRMESCLGRVSNHLVDMATDEGVDLLVVGTHQHPGPNRLWHESVSRGILRLAPMSVLCAPATTTPGPAPRLQEIHNVLVATDFSDAGDRAIPFAYSLLPRGGTVHLVHVVEMAEVNHLRYRHYDTGFPPTAEQRIVQEPELTAQLRGLIPQQASAWGVDTQVHIVEARDAVAAIGMAAERLGVDLICVGSHGRSGLSAVFAGSLSQRLIARSGRPVLVVGQAHE